MKKFERSVFSGAKLSFAVRHYHLSESELSFKFAWICLYTPFGRMITRLPPRIIIRYAHIIIKSDKRIWYKKDLSGCADKPFLVEMRGLAPRSSWDQKRLSSYTVRKVLSTGSAHGQAHRYRVAKSRFRPATLPNSFFHVTDAGTPARGIRGPTASH